MRLLHPLPPAAIRDGPKVATPTDATAPIVPPPPPLRRQQPVDQPRRPRARPVRTVAHPPAGSEMPFRFRSDAAAAGFLRLPAAARREIPASQTQPWDRRP